METQTEQNEAAIPKIVSKKCLLDIFIHNTEDNKARVDKLMKKIQRQINPYNNAVAVWFYMDKGEKTPEEKEQWFLEHGNARFYMVVNTLDVKSDFVKQAIILLKNYHNSLEKMKQYGIKLFRAPAKKVELTLLVKD